MTADIGDDLCRWSALDGPTGGEDAVAAALEAALAPFVDRVGRDALGNVVAERAPRPAAGAAPDAAAPVLWLTAALDEPTLQIAKIEAGGVLRFLPVGTCDLRAWLGQPVTVHGRRPLAGVIGTRPPHVLDAALRDATPDRDDLFVDLGLGEPAVRDLVAVGDAVTLRRAPAALAAGRYTGKALGRRAALAALVAAARQVAATAHPCAVRFAGATQSAVGFRGAAALGGQAGDAGAPPLGPWGGRAAPPDDPRPPVAAVALGTSPALQRGVDTGPALGSGPAIGRGPNVHPALFARLVAAARDGEIAHQVEALPALAPSEASVLQIAGRGVPTAAVAVPVRYGGTAVEVVAAADAARAARLVAAFAAAFDGGAAAALRPALPSATAPAPGSARAAAADPAGGGR